MKRLAYIILGLFLIPACTLSQTPDTTQTAEPDTSTVVQPDSVIVEPLEVQQESSDVDTTVFYDAMVIDNDMEARVSYFVGDAVVKYKDIVLKAGKITLDWDNHLIIAESILDTTWVKTDTLGTDSTIKVTRIGEPVLQEAGTEMTGRKMEYNYKTEKGRVIRGRSDVEGGKYVGTQIKRVDPNVFNVSHSIYTTCDLDSSPHFHFEARRMKMIPNDKVIAKPVVLKLGNIPVFALPFAIFPHRSGRHSGILIPRYGESAQEGRFLREIGYYWAPNDYFDAKLMVDFFEETGFLFRANTNYAIRYLLNGSISGSFTRKNFESGARDRRWDLRVNHSQEISPTSRFSVRGNFVSNNTFYKEYSTNLSARLNRELRSNATYSKSWPKHKLSLSLNLSHVRDLQEDLQTFTLPQLSFRKGQSQIFKPKRGSSRRDTHWYQSLYFSYNANLVNSEREFYEYVEYDSLFQTPEGEELVQTLRDTIKSVDLTRNISHDLSFSLNSPKKFFGWLSLNQSLGYNEDWFNETFSYFYDEETERIESERVGGFAARRTFRYSASANTKAYGMFPFRIGAFNSFRHVVTPSLSFNYQPDFSDPVWGYFQTLQLPDGSVVKRDKFKSGTPSSGGGSINLQVQNLFQAKKGEGEDEQKLDLFNVTASTAYSLRAERNNLSDLRTSWTANPMRTMSLSASTSHSFYRYYEKGEFRGLSNDFLWENGGWKNGAFMRLTNFRLNVRFRLQGKGDSRAGGRGVDRNLPQSYEEQQLREREEELSVLEEEMLMEGDRFEDERATSSLSIPWRMNVSFNFDLNKSNPSNPIKRYYMDISGAEISLTRHWRIGYSAHYDLAEREISHHRFTIYRDLHCWEANIDWVPTGPGRRVYVKVSIKAPMLKDIKIEKRGGQRSVLGY